jgi:hypothetical protein
VAALHPTAPVEAVAYDGRSQDPNNQPVWLLVTYEDSQEGWLLINLDRMVIPDGLLDRLPIAPWETPTATPPVPTPTPDPAWVQRILCNHNIDTPGFNPNPGRTIRFRTPIKINPNGAGIVKIVLEKIEQETDGLVTFEIVDENPTVGIAVVVGDSCNPEKKLGQGCGNVTHTEDSCKDFSIESPMFQVGSDGYINSLIYVHLGSPYCDYMVDNGTTSQTAITEHEIGHALGLNAHFEGFFGNEGLSPELLVILIALYSLPSGMNMASACQGQ